MRIRSWLLLSVLLLAGCYPQVPVSKVEEIESGKDLYSQTLEWSSCDTGFECSSLVVPLNWLDDTGTYFEIALIRPAGTENLTPLLVNPGGPGASGVGFVRDNLESIGTSNLRSKFQLIGFDPRGVGESEPVTCNDVDLKDEVYYGKSPYPFGSAEDIAWSKDLIAKFAADCQLVGLDLAYFNTQQTARDMDLIRQALGLDQLNYLGYSYGTELGAQYAAIFPDRVGKFVLDGAIDPTMDAGNTLLNQVIGFDQAFRSYLADCLKSADCPFDSSVEDGMLTVQQFLSNLESETLPSDFDREVTVTTAIYGIIAALYSQDSWPYLTQALAEGLAGDGTTLMMLADFYNDRESDGVYLSNINEANTAISCADARVSDAEAAVLAPKIKAASEVFGRYFAYPELACVGWPEGKGQVELDYTVALSNPPLVVGTTGDPATPYSQAVTLTELLDGARLVTFEGEGHTAYGSNSCVNELVESYLLGQELPAADMRCS